MATDDMVVKEQEEIEARRDLWKALTELVRAVMTLVNEIPRPLR